MAKTQTKAMPEYSTTLDAVNQEGYHGIVSTSTNSYIVSWLSFLLCRRYESC